MSEYIKNQTKRQEILKGVIRKLHEGSSVDEVKAEFSQLLQDVGATEIATLEQALIAEGLPEAEVKRLCDVHVAVFRDSLDEQAKPETIPGHPVHTFLAENSAAGEVLDDCREVIAALKAEPGTAQLERARQCLEKLREYDRHYLRKENLLFPYMESKGFAGPSKVMWAIHDDVRAGWKSLADLLAAGPGDDLVTFKAQIETIWGGLETAIREMFYKEENILYPTALEMLDDGEWAAIREQEADLGYSFVEPGEQWVPQPDLIEVPPAEEAAPVTMPVSDALLQLGAGRMTPEELKLLFNYLPIDITYVDQNDAVRFFTETERIFPRSPAIIGRKVQLCHPPASVHRVQQILDDFRAGGRDQAEFWIQMQGRFIHIRYFAVRDEAGEYQGTLEVTQDVTGIRQLEGERRLLDEEA
jgi:DUF438 domain-containing protein